MKGIILAGGTGSRLLPLTKVTNKHLLPVGKKPMIYYPLETIKKAGIKEVLIITGQGHAGHFVNLLGSGREFGMKISYEIQEEAKGIAHALSLAENFVKNESMLVVLGDNIFEEPLKVSNFTQGARIFLKEVEHPERFGVVEQKDNRVVSIEEKPKSPKSNLVVTGGYMYDKEVFDIIRTLSPSHRGEYEITDVNNAYLEKEKLDAQILDGFWSDAGTFESLYQVNTFLYEKQETKKE